MTPLRLQMEGVVFPDMQVRIPTIKGATPAEHIEMVNRYTQFKNWTPDMVKAGFAWVDKQVDAIQRNTLDLIIPGYAEKREGLENWWDHTPSVLWPLLKEYQNEKKSKLGEFLHRYDAGLPQALYQSHMGEECWQHSMSSGDMTAEEVQAKLVEGTLRNLEKFTALMKAGEYHNPNGSLALIGSFST